MLLCFLAAALVWCGGGASAWADGLKHGQVVAEDVFAGTKTLAYDVVVVGSDPEGVAAAISSARCVAKTLLVDTRPAVGGLMTQGWLNSIDMNVGPHSKILNGGIFLELYQRLGGDSFDVNYAQAVFDHMVQNQNNLDVLLAAEKIKPLVRKSNLSGLAPSANKDLVGEYVIDGVQVTLPSGEVFTIQAQAVIDATQDADLAAAAGVPYTFGHEDIGRPDDLMAVTLVFKLGGVSNLDWARIYKLLNGDHDPLTGANTWSAWGFYEATRSYQPSHPRIGLRGLNLGRQTDGSVLINALHIFDVDPLNPQSRQLALELGRAELPRLAQYLRDNIPGLENSALAGAAPELYIRESRHIMAEYRLTIDDVLENRDFDDRIAFGSYPVDIQATKPGGSGAVVGNPQQYAVPFRCLVPLQVDNLLVAGRSAGFDCLPHGSARTIPVGMATGQAAGAAAAQAIKEGRTLRYMAHHPGMISRLQNTLIGHGMQLAPTNFTNPLADDPDYAGLQFVRGLGIALGGYFNSYGLGEPLMDTNFKADLAQAVRQTGARVTHSNPFFPVSGQVLTLQQAAVLICRYQGLSLEPQEALDYLGEQGLWQQDFYDRAAAQNYQLTVGMGHTLIKDFITWSKG